MQLRRIVASVYRMLELLLQLYGDRGHGSEGAQQLGRQSRHELGVAERLVVAAIAEELGSIVEVVLQLVIAEAGLLRKLCVVTVAVLVEGDYEVIDGLCLGRDLAEYDAGACERGTMALLAATIRTVCKDSPRNGSNSHGEVVRVELLLVAQRLKVWLDGEGNNGRRAVGQILFYSFGVHVERVGVIER